MLSALWFAAALAQDTLVIPVGRAAVVQPLEAPTGIGMSSSAVRLVQAPPYLILTAVKPGEAVLTVEQTSGPHTWSITVPASGEVVGGLPGTTGAPIALGIDGGQLLPLPADTTATSIVKPDVAQAMPIGTGWLWLQGVRAGITDVVLERGAEAPMVISVPVHADAAPSAQALAGSFTVPVGGELQVDLGGAPQAHLVGHPSRLSVAPAGDVGDRQVVLSGLAAGPTWLVVAPQKGEPKVWAITVQ